MIHFCLDVFKVLSRELLLEAFGNGKVYSCWIDGRRRLALKRFADGIIEHGAKLCQGWRHDRWLGIQHLYSVFLCAIEIADVIDVDCNGLLDRCDGLHLFFDERDAFHCNPADKSATNQGVSQESPIWTNANAGCSMPTRRWNLERTAWVWSAKHIMSPEIQCIEVFTSLRMGTQLLPGT